MAEHYPSTSIIPPGRKRMEQVIQTTDIIEEKDGPKQQLGGFAPTSIIPRDEVGGTIVAEYRVVLTDNNGFEEVILENASTRGEAYGAYQAWLLEFKSDPLARPYPPDTWAVCTRNGELSWKTNPFIG